MILSTSYQMGNIFPHMPKHSLKPGKSNIATTKVVKAVLAKDDEYGIMLTRYSSTRQNKTLKKDQRKCSLAAPVYFRQRRL